MTTGNTLTAKELIGVGVSACLLGGGLVWGIMSRTFPRMVYPVICVPENAPPQNEAQKETPYLTGTALD